ncbi:MAG: hypothetical protein E5W59_03100 [Mesorhizobium sp.]|nr:MAG: hypothetical protein E5W59_03100 [Mesorhizobium sp.]
MEMIMKLFARLFARRETNLTTAPPRRFGKTEAAFLLPRGGSARSGSTSGSIPQAIAHLRPMSQI